MVAQLNAISERYHRLQILYLCQQGQQRLVSAGDADYGHAITISVDPEAKLDELLSRLQDLNMSGKLQMMERKGGGGFADIYIAIVIADQTRVCVKRPRIFGDRKKLDCTKARITCPIGMRLLIVIVQSVLRELRVWSGLIHENILPLKGFLMEDGYNCPSMVTEWMDKGSVKNYVCDSMSIKERIRVVRFLQPPLALVLSLSKIEGIACGLQYLHCKNIVHGDLKAVRLAGTLP